MSFDTQIVQLDSGQIDALLGIEQTTDTTTENKVKTVNDDKNEPVIIQNPSSIEMIEDLNEIITDEDDDNNDIKEDKEDKDNKDDKVKNDDKSSKNKKTEDNEIKTDPEVTEVLKNTVNYLIESGQWVDFDGREDLELTQEVYAELVAKQDEYRINKMFSELVDSTGDYGKAIISHIKNGGNPDEIIDLFKEQKAVEQLDTSTEKGKQGLIEKYYTDVLGWKKEKVDKTVNRLIQDNEIDSEFNDVKEMYDNHYQQKLESIKNEAKEQERITKQKQIAFTKTIRDTIDSNTTLSQRDKTLIASSILDFKHVLENGQKVNDFYIKFAELQENPNDFIDLVQYVMDPKSYKEKIAKGEESKANAKAFNFIKGNAALQKTKSTTTEINEKGQKERKGTDFSFVIKK